MTLIKWMQVLRRKRQRHEERTREHDLQQFLTNQRKEHRAAFLKIRQRKMLRQTKSSQKLKEQLRALTKDRNDALGDFRDRQRGLHSIGYRRRPAEGSISFRTKLRILIISQVMC